MRELGADILSLIAIVASDASYKPAGVSAGIGGQDGVGGEVLASFPDNEPIDEADFPTSLYRHSIDTESKLDDLRLVDGIGVSNNPVRIGVLDNWSLVRSIEDESTGFGAAIFISRSSDGGKRDVVVAFRGTDGTDSKDWYQNIDLAKTVWGKVWNEVVRDSLLTEYQVKGLSDSKAQAVRPSENVIHFVGQSLGGGLAQYAAYDYVREKTQTTGRSLLYDAGFSGDDVTLTTFNSFGAAQGLQGRPGAPYNPFLLKTNRVLVRHYAIANDVVSRLGREHLRGAGAGGTFILDFRRWEKGQEVQGPQAYLSMVDAHRIEAGFYRSMQRLQVDFSGARGNADRVWFSAAKFEYLDTGNIAVLGAFFSRLFARKTVSGSAEAWIRVGTGVFGVMMLGSPYEVNNVVRAFSEAAWRSGDLSTGVNRLVQKVSFGLIGKSLLGLFAKVGSRTPVGLLAVAVFFLYDLLRPQEKAFASDGIRDSYRDQLPVQGGSVGLPSEQVQAPAASDGGKPHGNFALPGFLPSVSEGERDKMAHFLLAMACLGGDAAEAVKKEAPAVAAFAAKLRPWTDAEFEFFGSRLVQPQGWRRATLDLLQFRSDLSAQALVTFRFDMVRMFAEIDAVTLRTTDTVAATEDDVLHADLVEYVEAEGRRIAAARDDVLGELSDGGTGSDYGGARTLSFAAYRPLMDAYRDGVGRLRELLMASGESVGQPAVLARLDEALGRVAQAGLALAVVPAGSPDPFLGLAYRDSASVSQGVSSQEVADVDRVADGGMLRQRDAKPFRLYLSDAAGVSGQRVELRFAGAGTGGLRVVAGGQVLPLIDGRVVLDVVPGATWADFSVWAGDTGAADGQLMVSAAPVSREGTQQHDSHLELILAFDADNETPSQTAIFGDRVPLDTMPDVPGVQPGQDEWRNVLASEVVAPGVVDLLFDHDARGYEDSLQLGLPPPRAGSNDHIQAGAGADRLRAYAGDDVLEAGAGADFVEAGIGDDRVFADVDIDLSLALEEGRAAGSGTPGDWITAGEGRDVVIGSLAGDILFGGNDDDVLVGGGGRDFLAGDGDYLPNTDAWWFVPTDQARTVVVNLDFGEAATDVAVNLPAFDVVLSGTDRALLPQQYRLEAVRGADQLYGGGGNDTLFGGVDDDLLMGDNGDDLLTGDEGSDRLYGGDGADVLAGDRGPGLSQQDEGDDVLDGGAGDDLLLGERGDDDLDGGPGSDRLFGDDPLDPSRRGNDTLSGGDDDDLLVGQGGDDRLSGGPGDDDLLGDGMADGADGADMLAGGEGDDRLDAGGGDDRLDGGAGDDVLLGDSAQTPAGAAGNDVLDGGDGDDILRGMGGDDRLLGGVGLDLLRGDAGDDDLAGQAGDDRLEGGEGDDLLVGGVGSDVLDGGTGRDTLRGGADQDVMRGGEGDDLYVFAFGDSPVIGETEEAVEDAAGRNVVRFEVDADPSTVVAESLANGDLAVRYSVADEVLIRGGVNGTVDRFEFSDGRRYSLVEFIGRFADRPIDAASADPGIVYFSGSGDDDIGLFGGDSTVSGGQGDDVLRGAGGGNRYQYRRGDGLDTIVEVDGGDARANRLVFGEGIRPQDVHLTAGSGVVQLGDDPLDAIEIQGFDPADPRTPLPIRLFEFADGQVVKVSDLLASGVDVSGGDGDDELEAAATGGRVFAGAGNDVVTAPEATVRVYVDAGAGDDIVYGSRGPDEIVGGPGDDTLIGQASDGDDVYWFRDGDGHDVIDERASASTGDVLRFGPGIVQGDLDFARRANGDLSIRLTRTGDSVLLPGFFASNKGRIDRFVFDAGESIAARTLDALSIVPILGTAGADRIDGTTGDDSLRGLDGDDILNGGGGEDRLEGGEGRDAYVLGWDGGADRVAEVPGDGGVVQLAAGIGFDWVYLSTEGDDLRLSLRSSGDSLLIEGGGADIDRWMLRTTDGASLALDVWRQMQQIQATDPVLTLRRAAIDNARGFWALGMPGATRIGPDEFVDFRIGTASVVHATTLVETAGTARSGASEKVVSQSVSRQDTVSSDIDEKVHYMRKEARFAIGPEFVTGARADPARGFAEFADSTSRGGEGGARKIGVHWAYAGPGPSRVIDLPYDENSSNKVGEPQFIVETTTYYTVTYDYLIGPITGQSVEIGTFESRMTLLDLLGSGGDDIIVGAMLADSGAGNDTIVAYRNGGWLNEEYPAPSALAQFRDRSTWLNGGDGDDTLLGANTRDALIGGSGNDVMDGGAGADTYVITLQASGWDVIGDGGAAARPESTADGDGFATWQEWRDFGYLPWLDFDVAAMDADAPEFLSRGFLQDDVILFGPGIDKGDIDATLALYEDAVEGIGRQVVLELSWGTGAGARVLFPAGMHGRFGEGIEHLRFANGDTLSMSEVLENIRLPAGWMRLDVAASNVVAAPVDGTRITVVVPEFRSQYDYAQRDGEDLLMISADTGDEMARFESWYRSDGSAGYEVVGMNAGSGRPMLLTDELTLGGLVVQGTGNADILNGVIAFANDIHGGAGADVLTGADRGDTLRGDGGNDTLDGLGGDDEILGGEGDDTLVGGVGQDTLSGGPGADSMRGGDGNDVFLVAGRDAGADRFEGGAGSDVIRGSEGDDEFRLSEYSGSATVERIEGGGGTDVIIGTNFVDKFVFRDTALVGIARIEGAGGDDSIVGSRGNDVIDGGTGRDFLYGGEGDDTFVLILELAYNSYSGGPGFDRIVGSAISDRLYLHSLTAADSIELIQGGGGVFDRILGTSVADFIDLSVTRLEGMAGVDASGGADVVIGTIDSDVIVGGPGADRVSGGPGDDTFLMSGGGTFPVEADVVSGGAGFDRIQAFSTGSLIGLDHWTPTDSVELVDGLRDTALRFVGGGVIADFAGTRFLGVRRIDGSVFADRILTPLDAAYVSGRSGDDTLVDQGPNDVLQGGAGNDTLEARAGDNLLLGDAGADVIRAGQAADIVAGGAGNDRIVTGAGRDVVLFRRGDGADRVDAHQGTGHVVSLGGGIRLADLSASREGADLRLGLGGADSLTFEDWYAAGSAHPGLRLQWWRPAGAAGEIVEDGSAARAVEWFDLDALAREVDASAAAATGLQWSLADALARAHEGGSDTSAYGGDLAWAHANVASLAGTALSVVERVLAEAGVEAPSRLLRPKSGVSGNTTLL